MLPTFMADTIPVLNLNVPDIALDRLAGISAATLAPVGAVQATVTDRQAGHVRLDHTPVQGPQPAGSDMDLLTRDHATVTSLRPVCPGPPEEVLAYVTSGG